MTKKSIREYAKQFQIPPCVVCVIPERKDIDEIYKEGISRKLITTWLQEEIGYEKTTKYDTQGKPLGVSEFAVEKHFKNQHHYQ